MLPGPRVDFLLVDLQHEIVRVHGSGRGVMVILLFARPLLAQSTPTGPAAAVPTPVEAATAAEERAHPDAEQLAADNAELHAELNRIRRDQAALQKQVDVLQPLRSRVTGYLDFGMFTVRSNDGSGIKTAASLGYHTPYGIDTPIADGGGVPDTWIFLGDPLSTTINSRGDPADTGDSRAVTFNPIGNHGKLSFIVNNFQVAFLAVATERLSVTSVIDFLPRARNVSKPGVGLGDFVDIKLAYGEYIHPLSTIGKLTLYAGKIDSVLGIEYRGQESPDRIAVSPSLVCRYTCGRPLGVKARAQLFGDALTFMIALTNGSSVAEQFPFGSEIDDNTSKTVSGRLSYSLPFGSGLEIGASGSYGSQDFQTKNSVTHWHAGVDIHLTNLNGLDFSGEFVQGNFEGQTEVGGPRCGVADCLRYKGAYGQIGYLLNNWLMPYTRIDWRSALHRSGVNFAYISDLARATVGIRSEIGTNVIVKAEYTTIRELGGQPQFPNDVVTSSMVIKW
ncbi:MAG: uncharacterized protein JWO36_6967 [Myxococcales bacterium]|nr:uncharacterized protein [Myxococcales bacterium]